MRVSRGLFLTKVHRYLLSDASQPKVAAAFRSFFLIGIFAVTSWVVYFAFTTFIIPYPIEFREGASQVMTQILLRGGNPFSLENQPLGMNNYGIVYNLFVLPLAARFGNTLLIHRVVTFVFLVFCYLLIFRTSFKLNPDVAFSLACGMFTVIVLAGRNGLGAFPSSVGTFLFLAGLLVPFHRSFDKPGLFFSILLSLMAFYTKPYFVLSAGIVAGYLFLFVSKRRGLLYALLFIFLWALSGLLVRYIFKLYFIDTIIGNLFNTEGSAYHVLVQLWESIKEFYPAVLLAALALFFDALPAGRQSVSHRGLSFRIDVLSFEKPLVSRPLQYLAFAFACSTLAFVLVLGLHEGNYMSYSYQLMLPPFFLWLFQKLRFPSRLALISVPLLLVNAVILCQTLLNPVFLLQRDSSNWAELYRYVDGSKRILNSPVIVSEMIRLGLHPLDSGQSEFYYRIRPYPEIALLGPTYQDLKRQGVEYRTSLLVSMRKKEFDRIIVTEGDQHFLLYGDIIGDYYSKVTTITVEMPQSNQQWRIEIWEPRQ